MGVGAPAPEAPPIFESMPNPAMSWNSSTPETLEFSLNYEPPVKTFNPVESWEGQAKERGMQNNISDQKIFL